MAGDNALNGSGVILVESNAPSDYHVAPRTDPENPLPVWPVLVTPPPKKRGRKRMYVPDGSVGGDPSPNPISSSAPTPAAVRRGKIRPGGGENESLGDWVSCAGANFTPHFVTVNVGEDVMMKLTSLAQQAPRAICILSANGLISNVTLRQPVSSGGAFTYEGCFRILSLTGSFMPPETGGMRNRSGSLSVSLASPDGHLVGGGVAGSLVAASPVQILVGAFLGSDTTSSFGGHNWSSMPPVQGVSHPISI